jgi:hypothetical protein
MSHTESLPVARKPTQGVIQQPASSVELTRIKYAAIVVGAGLVVLAVVFGVAVARFTSASSITAVIGPVASVIGTIVGAFFGVHVGASGKATAEAGRANAEKVARMALAKLNPHDAEELRSSF